jgi:hypothetical protein
VGNRQSLTSILLFSRPGCAIVDIADFDWWALPGQNPRNAMKNK